MEKPERIEIAFILDEGFVIPTATAITSLIDNKDDKTIYDIHLVTSNLSDESIIKFNKYSSDTVFINIVKADASKYVNIHKFDSKKPCCATLSALLKFELPYLLSSLDKILYLDGDILVQKDLSALYNTKLENNYVAAVKDSGRMYFKTESTKHIENYFNSGVMLLNLKKMREDNMTERLIEAKKSSTDMSLMDQNIFNIVFEGAVKFLDIKYNFLYLNLTRAGKQGKYTMDELNDMFDSSYKDIIDIKEQAYIIHFSSKDKPWKFFNVPGAKEWLFYHKKSKFFDKRYPIQEEFSLQFPPKISIIIPVYNVEKYIKECLESVINQTLENIEIICINDGSTDQSANIIKEYTKFDKRIKLINTQNRGVSCARNTALKFSTGEYIMFLDADDYIINNALHILYTHAHSNNLDMLLYGGTNFDNITGISIDNPYYQFKYLPENFNTKCFNYKDCVPFITRMAVSSCLTLYRHEFISMNNIEFPPHLYFEDNIFFCMALFNAQRIGILKDVFYYRRLRKDSITQTWADKHMDFLKISVKVFEYLKSINVNDNILEEYHNSYCNSVIDKYNSFENKYKKKYYRKIKNYTKKYCPKLIYKIKKPKTIFVKIFSINNEGIRKVVTLLGIKFKFKSKKLIQKQRIDNIEKDFRKYKDAVSQNILMQNEAIKDLQHVVDNSKNQITSLQNKINNLTKQFNYKLSKYIPEEKYSEFLKDWYFEKTGEFLNLDNPQTFNEKIQWMKLNDSTPLKARLADKYLVRDWVKEKIGEEYLIPFLGVWDNFDEIDFDKLPDKFVLKCNHGCGYNIIVKDKSKLNKDDARKKINMWLNEDYAFVGGLELQYSNIPRKIIAEKYIENNSGNLYDYKFWCFNGKVEYIQFLSERNTDGLKMAFYDRNWIKQDFVYSYPLDAKDMLRPENLELMIHLAEELSSGFNHVRVDFYRLNDGTLYFGEMTFTSCSGTCKWSPITVDCTMGQMFDLPMNVKETVISVK